MAGAHLAGLPVSGRIGQLCVNGGVLDISEVAGLAEHTQAPRSLTNAIILLCMHRPIKPARREGKGHVMRKVRELLTCCYFVLGVVLPSWAQGVLENPSVNSFQSGIGMVSG